MDHRAHLEHRRHRGPVKASDHRGSGLNARIGLRITLIVGCMWTAYVFAFIALVSFPAALQAFAHGDTVTGVAWLSQSFLQLALLPIIIVGQNIQARAADERSEQMFADTEIILDRLDADTAGGIKDVLDAIHAIGK